MKDDNLQKLILTQLEEINKIVRNVDTRLTKLETSADLRQEGRDRKDAHVSKELETIDHRLENLEKFRLKLVIGAGVLAFMATIFWEIVGPYIMSLAS